MTKSKNRPKSTASRSKSRRPIADMLIKRMRSYVGAKVVDLSAVMAGKHKAEELQQTVPKREELADYHPAHALYIYAQNQTSVMAEQLTALPEMERFARLIEKGLREAHEVGTRAGLLERVRLRGVRRPPPRRHLSPRTPRRARQPSALQSQLVTTAAALSAFRRRHREHLPVYELVALDEKQRGVTRHMHRSTRRAS